MHGILKLRSMVQHDPAQGWRERYGAERTVEVLPEEGEALMAETSSPCRATPSTERQCLTRPASSCSPAS